MQIHLVSRHLEITDDIRTYIEKRAKKIEVIFNPVIDFQVVMGGGEKPLPNGNYACNTESNLPCPRRNARCFLIARRRNR